MLIRINFFTGLPKPVKTLRRKTREKEEKCLKFGSILKKRKEKILYSVSIVKTS